VQGFETDGDALLIAERRIRLLGALDVQVEFFKEDFLEHVARARLGRSQSDLFTDVARIEPDLVIANPPYVRTQILGAEKAQVLSQAFGLKGRVDLYHAFVLAITALLRDRGVLGIIVSNRFMTTRAGATVRECFLTNYRLRSIWDLGDTRLFSEAVLPAVVIAERDLRRNRNRDIPFVRTYSATLQGNATRLETILDGLKQRVFGQVDVQGQGFEITAGNLDHGPALDGVWRVASNASDTWLATVEANQHCAFRDLGKIRVGIKTTADKVFIRSDWASLPAAMRPEKQVLRALIGSRQTRKWRENASGTIPYVLYTHKIVDGKRVPVRLGDFPKASAYLHSHRRQLEARDYVIEANRNWYEIWVPQDPAAWARPKLVFRDIAETGEFLVDLEGKVVNGDCYWVVSPPGKEELLWLAMAVGNSKFAGEFYDHKFHNKLYAGRRRFMSQYVELFPLPNSNGPEARKLIALAKRIYASVDREVPEDIVAMEREVDRLVYEAFGLLELEEVAR
ncbi:MAG: Eco57I restriction-modification methylase domain-containing protein, partial [Terriglobia bacterium]